MKKEWIDYSVDGRFYRGYLVYDGKTTEPRPLVIVSHAWMGQDSFARKKADFLAELGYAGFALDLYGEGIEVESSREAAELMMPLFAQRQELQKRIKKAYEVAANHPICDRKNIGSIGFCFGGLAALELLRSGVLLKGTVGFHALLGDRLGDTAAQRAVKAEQMHGSLLILHGYKDPLVSASDIAEIQKEFSNAHVDWQMHIYGDASHAFTNPEAKDPLSGLIYHPKTEQRALQSMRSFFAEVFE